MSRGVHKIGEVTAREVPQSTLLKADSLTCVEIRIPIDPSQDDSHCMVLNLNTVDAMILALRIGESVKRITEHESK